MLYLVKNPVVKKEAWDCAFSWCKASSFVVKVRCTFSRRCRRVVRPAYQDEFLVKNSLDVKENGEHALDFAPHLSRPLDLSWTQMLFKHPCTAHVFFPDRLSNRCQGLRRTFPRYVQNLKHTRLSFVGSIAKSHQARYTVPIRRK
jgi:hypothetical protein